MGTLTKPLTQDSMAGSRIFAADSDFLIGVNQIDGNRYVKFIESRYDKLDFDTVDHFAINDNQVVELVDRVSEESFFTKQDGRFNDKNPNIILDVMARILENKDEKVVTNDELRELYEGDYRKMSKQTFYSSIKKLKADGRLSQPSQGVFAFPDYLD